MKKLTRDEVLARLRRDGANSSHFVWLQAELEFFEATNGHVFACVTKLGVRLVALEPLTKGAKYSRETFREAWAELNAARPAQISAFVSVYSPFASILKSCGFRCLKIGEEPWMDLAACIPTGNAGKGVRSARNQALRSGVTVEEWHGADLDRDAAKRAEINDIYDDWRSSRLVELTGFMNATDALAFATDRRYFVLRSKRRIEAYLVATPVPARGGWFLEDFIARASAPRGSGELLTLESMVALGESGASTASLGVVSLTSLDSRSGGKRSVLPPLVRAIVVGVPRAMSLVYNFNGLETYRKRFKPKLWDDVHLAVRFERPTRGTSADWFRVMFAILVAFNPRPRPTLRWCWRTLVSPLKRAPLSSFYLAASGALFVFINRLGDLPEWASQKLGFIAGAPTWQWIYRSVVSDFLYFKPIHYLGTALPLVAMLYWAERTQRRKFLVTVVATTIVVDDVLNYWLLVKPFELLRPQVYRHITHTNDVGGSLLLALLVGIQICQFRAIREPLAAILTLGSVLAVAFTSEKLEWLILNLNHALFFVIGFLLGKLAFALKRQQSRRAAKGKPPVAKSVR